MASSTRPGPGANAPRWTTRTCARVFTTSLCTTTARDIIRAFLEGVALNTRWLMKPVEKFLGRSVDRIHLAGGGAGSDVWCQIFADVLGIEVVQVKDPIQANARGAALHRGRRPGRDRARRREPPGRRQTRVPAESRPSRPLRRQASRPSSTSTGRCAAFTGSSTAGSRSRCLRCKKLTPESAFAAPSPRARNEPRRQTRAPGACRECAGRSFRPRYISRDSRGRPATLVGSHADRDWVISSSPNQVSRRRAGAEKQNMCDRLFAPPLGLT